MRDYELLKAHCAYTEDLKTIIKNTRKRIEKNGQHIIPGKLKYHRTKNGHYFYSLRTANGEEYLGKKKRHIASAVAQNEYDLKVLSEAERLLSCLEAFDRRLEKSGLETIFEQTIEAKKPLITPAVPIMEKFAAEWEAADYIKKPIGEGIPDYITEKQEHVRSKSELMIANALYRHRIPYRYEAPLEVAGRIIHPDFTVLDKRTGRVMYWEHLGMLDDSGYRAEALRRMQAYESAGMFSGTEIIYSVETMANPLTPASVESKIKRYFL